MLLPHIWLCFPDPPSHPISVVLFPEHVSTFLTQCFSRLSSRPGMSFPWCLVSSWLSSSPPSGTGQIFPSHGGLSWISLSPRTTSILSASAPFSVFLLPTSVSRGTTYFPTDLLCVSSKAGTPRELERWFVYCSLQPGEKDEERPGLTTQSLGSNL